VLAVGESEEQFDAGLAGEVVARQLEVALAACADLDRSQLAVAYEPVWAIGTGRPAVGTHAAAAAHAIRAALGAAGLDAEATPVLYGGSVSSSGVAEFAAAEGIDGALVGGASLKPDEFAAIVKAFS
jgi:triosephosphate isomerase